MPTLFRRLPRLAGFTVLLAPLLVSLAASCAAITAQRTPASLRAANSGPNALPAFDRVRQITGLSPQAPWRAADPALQPQPDGSVWISGTGDLLSWPGLDALMSGAAPSRRELKLFQRVGAEIVPLNPDELPWDLEFYTRQGKPVLLGGVMSPRPGASHARWPDDNISRRIRIADYDAGRGGWVFAEQPFFGTPDHQNWPGHAYGHQLWSEDGKDYVFHEEVSYEADDASGRPRQGTGHFATELFVRPIGPKGPGEKVRVLGVADLPLAATRRVIGGFLLEGPRPARYTVAGKPVHVVYFSTGDYPTKNYTVRAAYSTSGVLGPYRPVHDDTGAPLNLTGRLQDSLHLYGVGRAFPFSYQDQPWIVFHGAHDLPGVDHTQWPKQEPLRELFVAPLQMAWRADGSLSLHIAE